MAEKWIQKAIKKPGALRAQLGAKPGKPIPAAKLAAAAKKPGKIVKESELDAYRKKATQITREVEALALWNAMQTLKDDKTFIS